MSAPKTAEMNIGVMPFIVIAIFLIVPFLNFEITYFYMSLKLFGFSIAVAVLACYLLWEWATGRLRASGLPAYWLFAPAAMWVVWGLLTTLWSRDGWLGAGWVVQGAWGLGGAWGLAVLLRERGPRQVFVAASSAVALVVALLMAMVYGEQHQPFFGDVDLLGRSVAAAFLLVPTLVAAAMLFGLGPDEDESAYKPVVWLVVVLIGLLLGGLRTLGSSWPPAAWVLGLGAGVAIVVWLMLPKWRLGAVALAVFLVVAAMRTEVDVARASKDFLTAKPLAHYGLFDATDRQVFRSGSFGQVLFGRGVGSYLLVLDRHRTPETYATPRGGIPEGHARRYVMEVATERGVVGLALGAAMGVVCLVAGAMAVRRAQSRFDAALGAGLAAGVAAMGVFGCYSNGTAGFGAGMAFWVALGLLGALSVKASREAALGYSAEEESGARERRSTAPAWRGIVAIGGALAVLAVWFALAVRPFLADWYLKEGVGEVQDSASRGAGPEFVRRAESYLGTACSMSLGDRLWLQSQVWQAQLALDQADRGSTLSQMLVAQYNLVQRMSSEFVKRLEPWEDACGPILALDFLLGRCSAVSLNKPVTRALFELATADGAAMLEQATRTGDNLAQQKYPEAAARLEHLEELCGRVFDLDVLLGRCHAELGQPKAASEFFARYLRKDPFAISSALHPRRLNCYDFWFKVIYDERQKENPAWEGWAKTLAETAAAGLEIDPNRYALLMLHGQLERYLGNPSQMRHDMAQAAEILKEELKMQEHYPPVIRGRLLVERANALLFVDKAEALRTIKGVASLGLSRDDPPSFSVLQQALQLQMELEEIGKPETPGKKTDSLVQPEGERPLK